MKNLLDNSPLDQHDIPRLVLFTGVMFIFFWIIYVSFAVYMGSQVKNRHYQNLPLKQKGDYLSRLVANVHAVLAVIMGFVLIFATWYILLIMNDSCIANMAHISQMTSV